MPVAIKKSLDSLKDKDPCYHILANLQIFSRSG